MGFCGVDYYQKALLFLALSALEKDKRLECCVVVVPVKIFIIITQPPCINDNTLACPHPDVNMRFTFYSVLFWVSAISFFYKVNV